MKGHICAIVGACLFSTACANLNSISRTTTLPAQGLAIHLDAQQRLVYSDKDGHICSEINPGAIQSVSESGGIGASVKSEGAGSASGTMQQSAADSDLRTQSISLVREDGYLTCELAHAGYLKGLDVVQLREQAQAMTLAVLAVEQLTGAVVGQQPILTSASKASSSAQIGALESALKDARKNEVDKKSALDSANAKLNSDTATKAAHVAAGNAPQADDDAINSDQKAVDIASADYNSAQKATKAIDENFNAATTASSEASSSGQFAAETGGGSHLDKDTAQAISTAVQNIVVAALNQGHLTDACLNLFAAVATHPDKNNVTGRLVDMCNAVIAADLSPFTATVKANFPSQPANQSAPPAKPQGTAPLF